MKTKPATHTPGPWNRNIRANGKYPMIFAGRNNYVAIVQQQKDGAEMEANIDLIAAAPDGYKLADRAIALDQVMGFLATLPSEFNDNKSRIAAYDIVAGIKEMAVAFLAKAEGR